MKSFFWFAVGFLITLPSWASFDLKYNTPSQEWCFELIDVSDGTSHSGETIANTEVELYKAGATSHVDKNLGACTEDASTATYCCVFDATDTNTYGPMKVVINNSGSVSKEYNLAVVNTVYWDTRYGTDRFQVHVREMDNAVITSGTIATDAIGSLELNVDGAEFTAIPWNSAWDAEVQSEATDALNAYDPTTNTEFNTKIPQNMTFTSIGGTQALDVNAIGWEDEVIPEATGTGIPQVDSQYWNAIEITDALASASDFWNTDPGTPTEDSYGNIITDMTEESGGTYRLTEAAMAASMGLLNVAASTGDPGTTTTAIAYLKQIVNILAGTAGVATFPAAAAPGNGVSLAQVARSVYDDTNYTQGTPNAYKADVSALATSAELDKVPKSDGTVSWNATALASINAEADTAIADFDPPTRAELTSDINSVNTNVDATQTTIGAAGVGLTNVGGLSAAAEASIAEKILVERMVLVCIADDANSTLDADSIPCDLEDAEGNAITTGGDSMADYLQICLYNSQNPAPYEHECQYIDADTTWDGVNNELKVETQGAFSSAPTDGDEFRIGGL